MKKNKKEKNRFLFATTQKKLHLTFALPPLAAPSIKTRDDNEVINQIKSFLALHFLYCISKFKSSRRRRLATFDSSNQPAPVNPVGLRKQRQTRLHHAPDARSLYRASGALPSLL